MLPFLRVGWRWDSDIFQLQITVFKWIITPPVGQLQKHKSIKPLCNVKLFYYSLNPKSPSSFLKVGENVTHEVHTACRCSTGWEKQSSGWWAAGDQRQFREWSLLGWGLLALWLARRSRYLTGTLLPIFSKNRSKHLTGAVGVPLWEYLRAIRCLLHAMLLAMVIADLPGRGTPAFSFCPFLLWWELNPGPYTC